MIRFVLAAQIVLLVAACGKQDAPQAPGPADQVSYPKIYPTK